MSKVLTPAEHGERVRRAYYDNGVSRLSDETRQAFESSLAALVEGAEKYEALRHAINQPEGECDDARCDSYGHFDECAVNMDRQLVKAVERAEQAEAALVERCIVHEEANATLIERAIQAEAERDKAMADLAERTRERDEAGKIGVTWAEHEDECGHSTECYMCAHPNRP